MVTLLPIKKKKRAVFGMDLIYGNMSAVAAFGVLVLVAVLYLGLVFYEKGLEGSIEDITGQAKNIEESRDVELEDEVYNFAARLDAVASLLDSQIYSSKLFTMIEEITHPAVQFTNFTFKVETGEVFMNGVTSTYTTLGEQIIALEQNSKLSGLQISNIKIDKTGQISFSVSFEVNRQIFANQ